MFSKYQVRTNRTWIPFECFHLERLELPVAPRLPSFPTFWACISSVSLCRCPVHKAASLGPTRPGRTTWPSSQSQWSIPIVLGGRIWALCDVVVPPLIQCHWHLTLLGARHCSGTELSSNHEGHTCFMEFTFWWDETQ